MNCEIVCVGTELLLGDIVNTNAAWIAKELASMGVNVYYQTVVGDNPERLKNALGTAFSRADMVLTTGGLGPTKDDLTKETAVSFLKGKLVVHEPSLEHITQIFTQSGRSVTESVKKQAFLPEGCIALHNYNGTAPGFIYENNGKVLIMLPGPPREMIKMFDTGVRPYLAGSDKQLFSTHIRIVAMGESEVADRVADLMDNSSPTVAPYAKSTETELRVTVAANSREEADALMAPTVEEIKKRIGRYIYGINVSSLEERVFNLLNEGNLTVSFAESITGGLIAKRLTDISGSSKVFPLGAVTYATEMKEKLIGVDPKTVEEHTVYSAQVAAQMAKGIRELAGTDIGLSITGIAGPDGGSEEKPVGLCYVGISDKNGEYTMEYRLGAKNRGRNMIREFAAGRALDFLRRHLEDIL